MLRNALLTSDYQHQALIDLFKIANGDGNESRAVGDFLLAFEDGATSTGLHIASLAWLPEPILAKITLVFELTTACGSYLATLGYSSQLKHLKLTRGT